MLQPTQADTLRLICRLPQVLLYRQRSSYRVRVYFGDQNVNDDPLELCDRFTISHNRMVLNIIDVEGAGDHHGLEFRAAPSERGVPFVQRSR